MLDNKYTKTYFNIIYRARQRKIDGYFEKHHIIPKHMGGSNDPSNLVTVTIQEHANLHKQLWEELGNEEDRIAWMCLSGQISNSEATIMAIKNANTGRKVFFSDLPDAS